MSMLSKVQPFFIILSALIGVGFGKAFSVSALFDELMEGFDNKYLLIGFDMRGNLIEVMYNLAGEDIANIFHLMRCRKEFLRKLPERGYYADFD